MEQVTEQSLDEAHDEEEEPLTLVDHLTELRSRLIKSLIAIAVGAVVAFIFREPIMHFLTWPLPQTADQLGHGRLVVTGLAEGFTVFLKLSIAGGILAAMPIILYQAWAFVAPGLYEYEQRTSLPFVFGGFALFLAGIALGFVVLQYPVQWLVSFGSTEFTELVTADSYFTFVAFFLLAFGVVFEIPLVLTLLAQLGLVTSYTLRKKRPTAHVGMWVAATFLTPGADIYSPVILGVTMSVLFELSVFLMRIVEKRKERR